MAMNNYILQKIIHAYQNSGADLCLPHYIDRDMFGKASREHQVRDLYTLSKSVQQSAKFFVDMTGEQLKNEEVINSLSDLEIYLPYPITFIQFKHQDGYVNCLFIETGLDNGIDWKGFDPSKFMVGCVLSDLSGNQMTYDRCTYHYSDTKINTTKTAQVLGAGGACINDVASCTDFSASVMLWYLRFLVMLNHPEITVADEVLGRPNNIFGHVPVKNMKRSTLIKKPKYQHKTLVLDMFGDKSGGESCSSGRSKGTAFHSVRKHLRQYKNGKKVFVKAHFRGSKEMGVVTKDYELR